MYAVCDKDCGSFQISYGEVALPTRCKCGGQFRERRFAWAGTHWMAAKMAEETRVKGVTLTCGQDAMLTGDLFAAVDDWLHSFLPTVEDIEALRDKLNDALLEIQRMAALGWEPAIENGWRTWARIPERPAIDPKAQTLHNAVMAMRYGS